MTDDEKWESLTRVLQHHTDRIGDMYTVPVRVTIIIRVPGEGPEAAVCFSSDTLEGIESVVQHVRRTGGAA